MGEPGPQPKPRGAGLEQRGRTGEGWPCGHSPETFGAETAQPWLTTSTVFPAHLSVSCQPQRDHTEGWDPNLASLSLSVAHEWYTRTAQRRGIHLSGMVLKTSWRDGHLYRGREDRAWLVGQESRCVCGHGAPSMEAPKVWAEGFILNHKALGSYRRFWSRRAIIQKKLSLLKQLLFRFLYEDGSCIQHLSA